MRRGTCVKCGSTDVRAAANGLVMGEHVKTGLRPHLEPGFRGAVRIHQTDLWSFGCVRCGYVELYLLDPAARQFVAERWAPVTPPPPTTMT